MKTPINMKVLVMGTLFVIVALIGGVLIYQNTNTPDVHGIAYDQGPNQEGQPIKGDPDARVTITEFGDYKCPSCKAWDETILPQLEKNYIDDGLVNLIYINTPFHGAESELAVIAGEYVWESNPDVFWSFHSAIFEEQPAIESHDDPWVTEEKVREIAGQVSDEIDQEALMSASQEQMYRDRVLTDINLVNEFEVEKTPTIMVNQVKLEDPFNYEVIKQQIDSLLEGE